MIIGSVLLTSALGLSSANTVNYATTNIGETFTAVASASNTFRSRSAFAKCGDATAAYASGSLYQDAAVDTSTLTK